MQRDQPRGTWMNEWSHPTTIESHLSMRSLWGRIVMKAMSEWKLHHNSLSDEINNLGRWSTMNLVDENWIFTRLSYFQQQLRTKIPRKGWLEKNCMMEFENGEITSLQSLNSWSAHSTLGTWNLRDLPMLLKKSFSYAEQSEADDWGINRCIPLFQCRLTSAHTNVFSWMEFFKTSDGLPCKLS